MKNYQDLLRETLIAGEKRTNRTGINTLALFGRSLTFDLTEGFPAVTTKKLNFNAVAAELAGFLEGTESASRMRELGTKIWDLNANSHYWQSNPLCRGPDDMGKIYGAMWRNFNSVDQIKQVIRTLRDSPDSRRMIVTAWDPAEKRQCLPPCHIFWQLDVSANNKLNCAFYMRSLDLFLGAPFDIASYALLQHIIAQQVGFEVGMLTMFIGNCHIYDTHIEAVKIQLSRETHPLPKLRLDPFATVDNFIPAMASLENYKYEPFIKAEMVV